MNHFETAGGNVYQEAIYSDLFATGPCKAFLHLVLLCQVGPRVQGIANEYCSRRRHTSVIKKAFLRFAISLLDNDKPQQCLHLWDLAVAL